MDSAVRVRRGAAVLVALALLAAPAGAHALTALFRARVGDPPGPASPVFDSQRAYLVSAGGALHAVDRTRGREVWSVAAGCGADALALVEDRVVCAAGGRARLAVVQAATGEVLLREAVEGGAFAVRAVGPGMVFHDRATGRILGFDAHQLSWRFDHRTEGDALTNDPPALLALGSRYLYTEDERRTLRGVSLPEGRIAIVARSDTPIRIDGGAAARMARGVILSHTDHAVQAFDATAGVRAWRFDAPTKPRPAKVVRVDVAGDLILVLLETELPVPPSPRSSHAPPAPTPPPAHGAVSAPPPPAGVPPRWPILLGIHLRSGDVQWSVPLYDVLPFEARMRLVAGARRACSGITVSDVAFVRGRPVIAVAATCPPGQSRFPHGWVVAIDLRHRRAAWTSPPGMGTQLVTDGGRLYTLWGAAGVPHAERVVHELDIADGGIAGVEQLGYAPTWATLDGDQLWVGTTSGAVVVFAR